MSSLSIWGVLARFWRVLVQGIGQVYVKQVTMARFPMGCQDGGLQRFQSRTRAYPSSDDRQETLFRFKVSGAKDQGEDENYAKRNRFPSPDRVLLNARVGRHL